VNRWTDFRTAVSPVALMIITAKTQMISNSAAQVTSSSALRSRKREQVRDPSLGSLWATGNSTIPYPDPSMNLKTPRLTAQ
jgi:hypothetical protein